VSVLDRGGSVLLTPTWIGRRGDDQIASLAVRGRELIIAYSSPSPPGGIFATNASELLLEATTTTRLSRASMASE
jgi:hypothetical protein